MMRQLEKTRSSPWGRFAQTALGGVVGICLFAMMLLTFLDVVGRYLLGSPIRGAYEVTELLLPIVVFGILPGITLRREHVSTGLFDNVMKGAVLHLAELLAHAIGAVSCAAAAYALYLQMMQAIALKTTTSVLGIPIAPFIFFVALMSAIAAVLLARMAMSAIGRLFRKAS